MAEQEQPNIDKEVAVLEQLRDGAALRHSLDPAVSDFSGGSPEEIQAALAKWHAQGLIESTVPNPDVAEDGVQYRWQLNYNGKQYLELRGQEDKTPEEIHEEKVAEGQPQQQTQEQEQAEQQQGQT